jgi:LacI family transcriptional regulator
MSGKKEVTIYDVAKALDLSASTVSRGLRDHPAIKPQTIQRIKEMAGMLDYQQNTFASNLRKNRSRTIGVLLPRLDSDNEVAAHHVVLRYELIVRGSSLKNKPGPLPCN